MTSGLTEVFLVNLLDEGIVMALTKGKVLILAVECLSSLCTDILIHSVLSTYDGLTATVYATAGAAHDLDEIILLGACFNSTEKLLCVLGAACNSNSDGVVSKLVGSALNTLNTTNILEIKTFKSILIDQQQVQQIIILLLQTNNILYFLIWSCIFFFFRFAI